MTYLDTNVIVSFVNEKDPLHELAKRLVETLKERAITKFVILELYSVFSRVSKVKGLELEALVRYSIESVGAEVREVNADEVVEIAIKRSGELRLKTLDLLHVVAASLIDNSIATFDREIIKRREEIRRTLGIDVISADVGLVRKAL